MIWARECGDSLETCSDCGLDGQDLNAGRGPNCIGQCLRISVQIGLGQDNQGLDAARPGKRDGAPDPARLHGPIQTGHDQQVVDVGGHDLGRADTSTRTPGDLTATLEHVGHAIAVESQPIADGERRPSGDSHLSPNRQGASDASVQSDAARGLKARFGKGGKLVVASPVPAELT